MKDLVLEQPPLRVVAWSKERRLRFECRARRREHEGGQFDKALPLPDSRS